MGWLDRLRGKNRHDRFIQLLIDQAEYTVRGADALLDYLDAPSKDKASAVNELEKQADEVRRILTG